MSTVWRRHWILHQPWTQRDVVTECYINHPHNVISSLNATLKPWTQRHIVTECYINHEHNVIWSMNATSTMNTTLYRHWMLQQPWTQRHIVTECSINHEDNVISSLNVTSTMNTKWYRHWMLHQPWTQRDTVTNDNVVDSFFLLNTSLVPCGKVGRKDYSHRMNSATHSYQSVQ